MLDPKEMSVVMVARRGLSGLPATPKYFLQWLLEREVAEPGIVGHE